MHSLVLVDMNLPLGAIIPSFGRFLQYKVSISAASVTLTEGADEEEETHTSLVFLSPIDPQRNRKDALRNKINSFFKSSLVGLLKEELPLGKKLVNVLQEIFWYLDGHHYVFEYGAPLWTKIQFCEFINIYSGASIFLASTFLLSIFLASTFYCRSF